MTLKSYKLYVVIAVATIVALVLVLLLGRFIWDQATMERPHFNSGKIVQKDFNPAHYDDYSTQQYVSSYHTYKTGDNYS